mgnify:FL=1
MNQEQKQEAIQVMEVAAKLSGDALARLLIYGEGLRDALALRPRAAEKKEK